MITDHTGLEQEWEWFTPKSPRNGSIKPGWYFVAVLRKDDIEVTIDEWVAHHPPEDSYWFFHTPEDNVIAYCGRIAMIDEPDLSPTSNLYLGIEND